MYILMATVLIILVVSAFIFNRFIKYRFMMREASSGIDVQLKRRHDLIPNIVEAVKGYMQYERKLLEDITNIRARLAGVVDTKEKSGLENELSRGLKNIFAIAENYPDLKANKSFLDLQNSLVEVEDQIQLARRYYNGTVRNYNILAESFPSNLIARIFNFKTAGFFEIEYATERQVPDIKFGG